MNSSHGANTGRRELKTFADIVRVSGLTRSELDGLTSDEMRREAVTRIVKKSLWGGSFDAVIKAHHRGEGTGSGGQDKGTPHRRSEMLDAWRKTFPRAGINRFQYIDAQGKLGELTSLRLFGINGATNVISLNDKEFAAVDQMIEMDGKVYLAEVKTIFDVSKNRYFRTNVGGARLNALAARMPEKTRTELFKWAESETMRQKQNFLTTMTKTLGRPVYPLTVGVVLSAEKRTADIFTYDGFSRYISLKDKGLKHIGHLALHDQDIESAIRFAAGNLGANKSEETDFKEMFRRILANHMLSLGDMLKQFSGD